MEFVAGFKWFRVPFSYWSALMRRPQNEKGKRVLLGYLAELAAASPHILPVITPQTFCLWARVAAYVLRIRFWGAPYQSYGRVRGG